MKARRPRRSRETKSSASSTPWGEDRLVKSFERDLRKLSDRAAKEQVRAAILAVEDALDHRTVPNLKKLSGRGPYYRIRIREHRIGIRIEGDLVTFVRVLPRRDIYRHFP